MDRLQIRIIASCERRIQNKPRDRVVRRCWRMAFTMMGNVFASLVASPHSAASAERDPLVASFCLVLLDESRREKL